MRDSKRKSQTAGELLRELESDASYREMRAQQIQRARDKEDEFQRAEAPLVADLHAVGVKVRSVFDLVNTRASYTAAIPILLEHLQRDYPGEVREAIARALAVPEASWAWELLLSLFLKEPPDGRADVKWALAVALSGSATEDALETLITLIEDRSLGETRLALLRPLARSKSPRARSAIEELRSDPQLSKEIRVLCGSRKKLR